MIWSTWMQLISSTSLWLSNPRQRLQVGTTEEDGVDQISDSCDDEYEFVPTQTLFQMEASKSPTARALLTVCSLSPPQTSQIRLEKPPRG